jgi:hypothetical protein
MTNNGINQNSSERASIFISYSRSDRNHAERIAEELRRRGHEVSRDLDDILPTEEWRGRLRDLIADADVIVFLLSPKSAASDICRWEVDLAQGLNKKIAPIVVEDIEGAQIPQMLSRLNYIFATERDRFENAVNSLCDAISTDIDWLREHTRLTRLALRFEKSGRRKSDLLSLTALTEAERWLAGRPTSVSKVSTSVMNFIAGSRAHHENRSRYAEEKLKALTELVEPMLAKEVESLRTRACTLDDNWKGSIVKIDSEGSELRDRIKTIENFRSGRGRWHPRPANYIKNGGAQADYLEVYQFPCCGAWATLANEGEPLQFRADGCEDDPFN